MQGPVDVAVNERHNVPVKWKTKFLEPKRRYWSRDTNNEKKELQDR